MKHLPFFYLLLTAAAGIVSLTIGVVLYAKTKEKLLRYCLYMHSAFTLLVMLEVVLWYLRINLPTISLLVFHHATAFASRVFLFTLVVFTHYLFAVPRARLKNIMFGAMTVIMVIASYLVLYVMHTDPAIAEYVGHAASLAMSLYVLLLSIVSFSDVPEERRNLAKKFIILLGVSLPGTLADMLLEAMTSFRFFPLIYCGVGIMFTHHFLKYSVHPQPMAPHVSPDGTTERVSANVLYEQYNLSPREQEVLPFILQGCSNRQIGEKLFISVSTVKKHIRNIYQKCDVKSRYELIALFNNPADPYSML